MRQRGLASRLFFGQFFYYLFQMAHRYGKAAQLRGSRGFFIFAMMLGLQLRPANSLKCYKCTSTSNEHPFLCNEFMTNTEDIQTETCDEVHNAKFCVKQVGRFEGGIGTKRFCSSVDLGNYCDYVQQPGDKLTYRTCIYTCESDGCNFGANLSPSVLLNGFLLAVTTFKFLVAR